MVREAIICIIIVIGILSLEFYTQKFTEKSVKKITGEFLKIKESIENRDNETIEKQIKNIDAKWEETQSKLAFYIEHDELEKVHTAIVTMQSYLETYSYSLALAELEEGKFVLEHIQEKNSFNLQNIF